MYLYSSPFSAFTSPFVQRGSAGHLFCPGVELENKRIMFVKDFLILKGKINTKTFIIKPDVLGHFNSNLKLITASSPTAPS